MKEPKTVVDTEAPHSHGFHLSPNEPPDPQAEGMFAALRRVLPGAEVIRFLMVGGFNTVFSLALYSGCVIVFGRMLPSRGKPLIADIAFAISTPISITVAFLCYKHFVFRTKGNYLKEWLRCFAVYSVSFPMGLVILPAATHGFEHIALLRQYAPFLAGLVNSIVIACYSYFAHKKFSFKR
jgi:putative flippase GtrA